MEGYEFLSARQNGWFVVFYSYDFDGRCFSGEWRIWLTFGFSSIEEETAKVIARLPVGTRIDLRVDPKNPSRSVATISLIQGLITYV